MRINTADIFAIIVGACVGFLVCFLLETAVDNIWQTHRRLTDMIIAVCGYVGLAAKQSVFPSPEHPPKAPVLLRMTFLMSAIVGSVAMLLTMALVVGGVRQEGDWWGAGLPVVGPAASAFVLLGMARVLEQQMDYTE